jgi:hypothetical protein
LVEEAAEKYSWRSAKCQGTASLAAASGKTRMMAALCQGTTSVVPQLQQNESGL